MTNYIDLTRSDIPPFTGTIGLLNTATKELVLQDPTGTISPVVRVWTVLVESLLPQGFLDKDTAQGKAWRDVAPQILGSIDSGPSEEDRMQIITEWMWDALSFDCAYWVPEDARVLLEEVRRTRHVQDAVAFYQWLVAAERYQRVNAETSEEWMTVARLGITLKTIRCLVELFFGQSPDAERYLIPAMSVIGALDKNQRNVRDFWTYLNPAGLLGSLTATEGNTHG